MFERIRFYVGWDFVWLIDSVDKEFFFAAVDLRVRIQQVAKMRGASAGGEPDDKRAFWFRHRAVSERLLVKRISEQEGEIVDILHDLIGQIQGRFEAASK